MKGLKYFQLGSKYDDEAESACSLMTTPVWVTLAKHPRLENIYVLGRLTKESVKAILKKTTTPFSSLTEFNCQAKSEDFIRLIPHLLGLRRLTLDVWDRSTPILPALLQFRRLQLLTTTGMFVAHPDIIPLLAKNCPELMTLKIENFPTEGDAVNDNDIKSLAQRAHNLRHLKLEVNSHLSIDALRSLGRYCHQLETCSLSGWINLLELDKHGPPLFPKMYDFASSGVRYDKRAIKYLIPVLIHHMPKLEKFDSDDGLLVDEVKRVLGRKSQGTQCNLDPPDG